MGSWQVQQAKAHFSELLDKAEQAGPQVITRHGTDRAVVLAIDDYRQLKAGKKDFITHLLDGPKSDNLVIVRNQDTGRAFKFED